MTGVLAALCVAVVVLGAVPVASTGFQLLTVPLHAVRNHYRRARPFHPRVAVVIPAWNEAAVLRPSVERLLALAYPPERLRVVVVDDASTDDTPEVLAALQERHPGRVVHLRRAVGGQGKAHTLNHGLRHLLGDDWMQATLIMDADVIYEPTALRRMTRHLADPDVAAVTAYIAEGSADRTWLTRFIAVEYVLAQLAGRRAQNVLGAMACLAGGAQLHARSNLEALGEIDTTTLAEDTVTTLETQLRGKRVVFEPHALVLAEEPASITALWKQRVRWARGNLQVTRRYRHLWFRPWRHRRLGSPSFGVQWFSVLYLPVVMLAVPVALVALLFLDPELSYRAFRLLWIGAACVHVGSIVLALQLDGRVARASAREAIAFPGLVPVLSMVTAFVPGLLPVTRPDSAPELAWTLLVDVTPALAMGLAWSLRALERRGSGRLVPALLYLVGYGPLLCAITLDAMLLERRGAEARWDKTEKIGRVAA